MRTVSLEGVFLSLVLILAQVFIVPAVSFWGLVPMVYLYALLLIPSERSVYWVLISGFLMGLAVDWMCDTPGMHAAATTLTAFLRRPLLRYFSGRDEQDAFKPGEKTMGFMAFWYYAAGLTLCHHLVLFSLEALSLFRILPVLWHIAGSAFLSLLLFSLFERFRRL